MRREMCGLVLMAWCGALLTSGCAKQAELKKDQEIAPVVQAPSAPAKAPQKEAAAPAVTPQQEAQISPNPVAQNAVVPEAKPESEAQKVSRAEARLQQGLTSIYFGFDSPKLSDEARATLAKNAELLKQIGKGTIRVEGNCDERGSDDYNLALGEKRAKEAVQYLVNLGIPQSRLSFISYGKEKPVATGNDEASFAKNRRDDFVVVP